MDATRFNALYPVGTPVVAFPGARPEDWPSAPRIVTRTRSKASVLGGHTDVVWVDGHGACIALTHIDPIEGDDAPPTTQWTLTPATYRTIDVATDRDRIFAKAYTESRDGRVVTVGIRIGEKPGHVVARYGDTVTRHADGTWTVQAAGGAS